MASKPETTFYRAVHKILKETYAEKMYNPLRGGTPDVWYSGHKNDFWVEYKWLPKLPVRVPIRMRKELTPLQLNWLARRYEEGRNVAAILGSPEGCWIFRDRTWEEDLNADLVRQLGMTRRDVAGYIYREVGKCSNICVSP